MSDRFESVSFRTQRFFRRREEFTLLPDKVRVEWARPLQSGTAETPVRFLDPTWTAQRGSGPVRYLLFSLFTLLLGAVFALTAYGIWTEAGKGLPEAAGMAVMAGFFLLLGLPLCLYAWWNGRYDIVVFTSLHPQYGPLVIPRRAEQELETLQFADAVSERIRLNALTKPDES